MNGKRKLFMKLSPPPGHDSCTLGYPAWPGSDIHCARAGSPPGKDDGRVARAPPRHSRSGSVYAVNKTKQKEKKFKTKENKRTNEKLNKKKLTKRTKCSAKNKN